eukprot:7571776-Pyramimonas_sp.AAC.1
MARTRRARKRSRRRMKKKRIRREECPAAPAPVHPPATARGPEGWRAPLCLSAPPRASLTVRGGR